MNGAEKLLETLVASGVEVCFANPGTSEMQLVSAIGNKEEMRAVLCLFEGVVSGAADGYARMSDKPAVTLLHVGSGFSNSMANLHNAKRAHSPVVNIVGDHATYHLKYDAPLTSDVPGHAGICSEWVKVSVSADDLADAGAEAVEAALKGAGKIASLVAPANHAWEKTTEPVKTASIPAPESASGKTVARVAEALTNGRRSALLLAGKALRAEGLAVAGRIAKAIGARVLGETFAARMQRGAGRHPVERLQYFSEHVTEQLAGLEQIVLVGAQAPVSFFAYPGKEGWLVPDGCEVIEFATADHDLLSSLQSLAGCARNAASGRPADARGDRPQPHHADAGKRHRLRRGRDLWTGHFSGHRKRTAARLADADRRRHRPGPAPESRSLHLACPDRKVIALQADGSAMYTVQALWSMARENTDVTVVIMNNRSYAILNIELARVGAAQPTPKTLSMLDLSRPDIDWVEISQGMGVPATRATTAEEFHQQFEQAMSSHGPRLIEAMVIQQMPA
jgi:acetolactate synthase-1/2/3 large subunit